GWGEIGAERGRARRYSQTLSDRLASAWEAKRKKARAAGTLATAMLPAWLQPAGSGDDRRAVVVPQKVAIVGRIFADVIAGVGLSRILARLLAEGVPPIFRRGRWARSTIRRLVTDRAVLGEYQPTPGRGKARPN